MPVAAVAAGGGLTLGASWPSKCHGGPWMDASYTLTLRPHCWAGCSDLCVLVLVNVCI